MSTNKDQPIIIKRIKKHAHAGHHGGAWKVAYADFVTAMMAFFLMMWLVGSTTDEQKAALSEYFTAASEVEGSSPQPTQHSTAVQGPGGASTSMIQFGGALNLEGQQKRPIKIEPEEDDPGMENDGRTTERKFKGQAESGDTGKTGASLDAEQAAEIERQLEMESLKKLKEELIIAIGASQAMSPYKDQVLLDITVEGLQIQIIDEDNRPMFDVGSVSLYLYSFTILSEIGAIINNVPNKVSITGHTDATPYTDVTPNSDLADYSNWELSADRANAARRALVAGGMDEKKVARVVGLADTVPFVKADPLAPNNRRISIIVMKRMLAENLAGSAESAADIKAYPVLIPDPKVVTPIAPEASSAPPAPADAFIDSVPSAGDPFVKQNSAPDDAFIDHQN